MKLLTLTLELIFGCLVVCFGQDQGKTDPNDRTMVIQSALKLAFSDDRLISPYTLTHVRQTIDSIETFVALDSIWIVPYGIDPNELPSEQFNFKVTSREEVCSLPRIQPIPYILEIDLFEYTGKTAKVKIETTCKSSFTDDCEFGIMCGQGVGIKMTKVKSVWEAEIEAQWAN